MFEDNYETYFEDVYGFDDSGRLDDDWEGYNSDSCDTEDESDYDPCDLDDEYLIRFADPGGRSALRAETPENPRNLPCPTCGRENMLTPLDRAKGYQCDICADALERGY